MMRRKKKEFGWGVAKGKAKVEKDDVFLFLFLPHYISFFLCVYICCTVIFRSFCLYDYYAKCE